MPNQSRGEVDFKLNGKTYTLRPTFDFLEKVESYSGKTIFKLIELVQDERTIPLSLVARILYFGAEAGAVNPINVPSIDEIYSSMSGAGLVTAISTAAILLMSSISSPEDVERIRNKLKANGDLKPADPS